MSTQSLRVQLPMVKADQERLLLDGIPTICFYHMALAVYRRLFDATEPHMLPGTFIDMFANIICTGVANTIVHRPNWRPLLPDYLPPTSSASDPRAFGIASQVWYYSTRPRTRMYMSIGVKTQIVAVVIRYLVPQLFLYPFERGSLYRFIHVAPWRWGRDGRSVKGGVMKIIFGYGWKILGTAAGCLLISFMGVICDNDTLQMIANPEADRAREAFEKTDRGKWESTIIASITVGIMCGIGHLIRYQVRKT